MSPLFSPGMPPGIRRQVTFCYFFWRFSILKCGTLEPVLGPLRKFKLNFLYLKSKLQEDKLDLFTNNNYFDLVLFGKQENWLVEADYQSLRACLI